MVVRDRVRIRFTAAGHAVHPDCGARRWYQCGAFPRVCGPASLVGNIYLGIVQNVLPSMERRRSSTRAWPQSAHAGEATGMQRGWAGPIAGIEQGPQTRRLCRGAGCATQ